MFGRDDLNLLFRIKGDSSDAQKAIKDVKGGAESLSGASAGLGSNLKNLAGPAAIAAAGLAAMAAGAITITRALFDLSRQAGAYGSVISDITSKTGLAAKTITTLKYAADIGGSSIEQVTSSLAKFSRTIGEAAAGSATAEASLKALGLNPQQALNDLDGSLEKVFKKIMDAPPGVVRTTLAFQAFGKSGNDLIPVIEATGGNLAAFTKEAERLGLTLTDVEAGAMDQFDDQMVTLGRQFDAVKMQIGLAFMPVFMDMARNLSEFAVRNKDEIKTWAQSSATQVQLMIEKFNGLTQAIRQSVVANGLLRLAFAPNILFDRSIGGQEGRERIAAQNLASRGLPNPADFGGRTPGAYDPTTAAGPGTGKVKKAPGGDPMRKFFEDELGLHITSFRRPPGQRTSTGGISTHGSGEGIDVRTRGRTIESIFETTAKAIMKGYRLFDERDKKGQPHQHYDANSDRASRFLGADMYGGKAELDFLMKLDQERLGRLSIGFDKFQEDQAKAEREAARERLAIWQEEWQRKREISDATNRAIFADFADAYNNLLQRGDVAGAEQVALEISAARVQSIQDEVDAMHEAHERLLEFQKEEIAILEANGAAEQAVAEVKRNHAREAEQSWHRVMLTSIDLTNKQRDANDELANRLQKTRDKTYELMRAEEALQERRKRDSPGRFSGLTGGIEWKGPGANEGASDDPFGGMTDAWTDFEKRLQESAPGIKAQLGEMGVMALRFGQNMIGAVGGAIEQWALYGGSVKEALQQALAAELAHLAGLATMKALEATALGFLRLAQQNYPAAGAAFKSAALWAALAVGSSVAARAVAPSRGGQQAFNQQSQAVDTSPLSRSSASPGGQSSGLIAALDRNTEASTAVIKKVEGMRPGDVLTKAAHDNPGAIKQTVIEQLNRDSGFGRMVARSMERR